MKRKLRVYGKWAGNPEGHPEDVTLCIVQVRGTGRDMRTWQCCRKRGYGPGKLYCKQHAKKVADDA